MTDNGHSEEKDAPKTEQDAGRRQTGQGSLPEADLSILISSLAGQAMISLGVMKNPVTDRTEKNLQQARLTIDLLDLLKEKTRGNLEKREEQLLDGVLYQLHLQYADAAKQGDSG